MTTHNGAPPISQTNGLLPIPSSDKPELFRHILAALEPLPDLKELLLRPFDADVPMAASQAMGILSSMKAGVMACDGDIFQISPSDPSTDPPLLPLPTFTPSKRLRTQAPTLAVPSTLAPRPVLLPTPPTSQTPTSSSALTASFKQFNESPSSHGVLVHLESATGEGKGRKLELKVEIPGVGKGWVGLRWRRGRDGVEGLRGVRYQLFEEGEKMDKYNTTKSPLLLSLSIHLLSLTLTLPDLLHRLPAYPSLLTLPCHFCGALVDGTAPLPVGRAWLAAPGEGKDEGKERGEGEGGGWVGFHERCWVGV